MYNFNLEGLENIDKFKNLTNLEGLGKFLATAGVLVAFFAILFAIAIVFLWVFSSIGIMNLAKKNNVSNAWLAFVPVGRSYLIGKLGFDIYAESDKKNINFVWVTLGLAAAHFVLGGDADLSKLSLFNFVLTSASDLSKLISFALLFFESWAFYNIFKVLNPKNSVVFTVFTALTDTVLGGVFLYTMKLDTYEKTETNIPETEAAEEKKEVKKETKKTEAKKEVVKNNFCSDCGTKIEKDTKFCPNCGKKIN